MAAVRTVRDTECATTGQADLRMHDERLFEGRPLVLCGATESHLKCTGTGAESVGVCSD